MAEQGQTRKRVRFPVIMAITLSLMALSILAVAAILPQLQKDRTNDFDPAAAEIKIGENDSVPQPTSEKELTLEPDEERSKYTVDKKVQITSSKNDEYLKAALIPQWYDAAGRLCGGLGELSDFGIAREPDTVKNIQQYVSAQNENFVILTYHLAPDWSKYWTFDKDTGFYHYKSSLKKNETTEPLILSVELSADVYALAEDYQLQIDVITESIQTSAGAEQIRAFGRKEE